MANVIKWAAVPNAHCFRSTRFNKPTVCEYCHEMIWGLIGEQGQACPTCNLNAHHKCAPLVPPNCHEGLNDPKAPQHQFSELSLTRPSYCSGCRNLIVIGDTKGTAMACDVCCIIAHKLCLTRLPLSCVVVSFESAPPYTDFEHWWVEGVASGNCSVCKHKTAFSSHLGGFACYWCSRQACSYKCQSTVALCDLGPWGRIKIAPTALTTGASSDTSHWKVGQLPVGATPVIVFVNPKSGGQMGNSIFNGFRRLLNPHQVFSLSDGGPAKGLAFMQANPHVSWRVLACGGDGTVAWVLQEIDRVPFAYAPPVAVLPLGTGNDLARAFGWGGGFKKVDKLPTILPRLLLAAPVTLDRWSLRATANSDPTPKVLIMNNYFSIGLDAKTALEFHNHRNANPHLYAGQTVNLMWYGKFGIEGALSSECKSLPQQVTLLVDDKPFAIPSGLEALVIVNIPSMYGGKYLWMDENKIAPPHKPQSVNDGLLEIVGITGTVHMAQILGKLAKPLVVAQAHSIKIRFDKPWPVQIDGEPWLQEGGEIAITHYKQSLLLARADRAHPVIKCAKQ